jgi:hypothetical protein
MLDQRVERLAATASNASTATARAANWYHSTNAQSGNDNLTIQRSRDHGARTSLAIDNRR